MEAITSEVEAFGSQLTGYGNGSGSGDGDGDGSG